MRRRKESLLIIICTSLFMFGMAGSRPLITLYSSELGANNIQIGIIVALYSLLPLFLSIYIGKIVDKVGKRNPLILSVILGCISLLIPLLFASLYGVYLSQIMAGLAQIIFAIIFQSYVGRFSKKKLRNYYVSIFSIGMAIGHFIGPLVSGFLADEFDYSYSLAILGCSLFIILPFVFYLDMGHKVKTVKQNGEMMTAEQSERFIKNPDIRRALFISAIILLGKDIFVAYFPLLAVNKGFSNSTIGLIIALNAAAGILIRLVLPILMRNYKENAIIIFSIFSAGVFYLILPFLDSIWTLSILSFFLGLSLGIGQPLSISLTINSLPAERVGEGLGLRLTVNKLTQVMGPLLLGGVANVIGVASIFYLCGAIIVTGAANLTRRKD